MKRLELIKTSITLEDEEVIELQIMKLNSISCDDEVKNILEKLENKDYGSVVVEIEKYLLKFSGVVVYEDKELQGLRLELKALEKKLQELSSDMNEYLHDIHEFNVQYHLHLGEIIQKILNLKEELLFASMQKIKDAFEELKNEYESIKVERDYFKAQKEAKEKELEDMDEFDDGYEELYDELQELKDVLEQKEQELNEKRKETKKAKEEFEEDEVTQEYKDVKQDADEFNREYEEIQQEDRLEISDEEKKELKQLYRKASKLCHPDIVSAELREQAQVIFQKLNDANSKRDLKTVKEILVSLESGNGFEIASDTIGDKDLLKSKIIDIRNMIYQSEVDIEIIKNDEVVQIIDEYDDLQDYFDGMQMELEEEYERLKNLNAKLEHTVNKKAVTAAVDNDDNYWNDEF